MNVELVKETAELIQRELEKCSRPAIAWSGGKDSMVMLFLVRQFSPDIPVLYFKGFPSATKHEFVKRIARELKLNLVLPEPKFKDLIAKDGKVELIQMYEIAAGRLMYFPVEAEPQHIPTPMSHCVVEEFLKYTNPPVMGFDGIFVGHRGDDVDPTLGEVKLMEEVVEMDNLRVVYPLKHWTERDIWEFSAKMLIPQNVERYSGDMKSNNDYFEACFECLKPAPTTGVFCPKKGRVIPRVGNEMGLEERREKYRDQLVNIQRREQ
jgi:3'-phosphoadenosine 5'-phosphosulfate sulfotransferase (PAPS reductase)/FAD synthetase